MDLQNSQQNNSQIKFGWMNENVYIKKNLHTKPCMFKAPDTHSAYV